MTLLTVDKVSKTYDKNVAIKNISFSFESEKCIALIGPNGAGKTTILRTLAGLLKPTSGTISFKGLKENDDIRKVIGYLPQYPQFPGWMTGEEFLIFTGQLAYLTKNTAKRRAEELLEKMGITDAKNKSIKTYSGGMKQRLGIAQAIIHKPKLLMLDEPVSSLDPIGRREVLTLMEELKKHMTILFSTHILTDADEISDELLLLNKGEIIEAGTIKTLRQKYQTTMIELQFQGDIKGYQEKVNALPSVINSTIKRDILHVNVTDSFQARKEILAVTSQNNWDLTNFSINQASLEDMFMKVVGT